MTIMQETPALGTDRTVPAPPPGSRAHSQSIGPLVLLDVLQSYVAETADWLPRATPGLAERSYELLELTDELEIWAIHWPQGQGLELHDHGGSVGALWVVEGILEEHYVRSEQTLGPPDHRVRRWRGLRPPLHPRRGERAGRARDERARLLSAHGVHDLLPPGASRPGGRSGRVPRRSDLGSLSAVDRLLAQARLGLRRVDPHQAKQIRDEGGLLIDIRPAAQRAEFGEVPGALIIERNNLEWRLDPGGSHRIPEAEDPDRPVVIICQEGYASSLAAASLMVWAVPRPPTSTGASRPGRRPASRPLRGGASRQPVDRRPWRRRPSPHR